jgi:hypothetical protein
VLVIFVSPVLFRIMIICLLVSLYKHFYFFLFYAVSVSGYSSVSAADLNTDMDWTELVAVEVVEKTIIPYEMIYSH